MVECSVCGRKKIRHQLYYQALVKRSGSGIIIDPTVQPNVYCWRCRQLHGLGVGRIAVPVPNSRIPYRSQYTPRPKFETATDPNLNVETSYSDGWYSMPCPECKTINYDKPLHMTGGLYACEKCGKHYHATEKTFKRALEKPSGEEDRND